MNQFKSQILELQAFKKYSWTINKYLQLNTKKQLKFIHHYYYIIYKSILLHLSNLESLGNKSLSKMSVYPVL